MGVCIKGREKEPEKCLKNVTSTFFPAELGRERGSPVLFLGSLSGERIPSLMASELIFRGHDEASPVADGYSPKLEKRWPPILFRPFHYFLREQRPLFVLVGIALASLFFLLSGRNHVSSGLRHRHQQQKYYHHDSQTHAVEAVVVADHHRLAYDTAALRRDLSVASIGGKIPLGLKAKGKRIVVTGGAGFVGSHLVDRLIERGDSVIVVDNFFTGRKENVMHHMGNPRFELIRHDVVEPILLEVDQIYHLACPASPVHYKFNPVKTIISFFI